MSECGKKRVRKSKLVPRALVDVDDGEEDLHLMKIKKIKPEENINRNKEPDAEEKQENVNEMQKSVPSHYQLEVAICDDEDWEYPEELEPCGEGNSHDDDVVNIKDEEPINNMDEMKIEVEECDLKKVKLEISTHSEEDYRIVEQSPVLNEQNDKEDVNAVEKCNEAGILRHVLCHQTKIKTRSLLKPLASEVPIIIGPVSGAKNSVLSEHNYVKNPEKLDTTQLLDARSNFYYKSKIMESSPDLLAEFNEYKLETRPAGEKHILITSFKTETALLEHGLKNQTQNAKIDESTNESKFKGFWSHKRGIHYAKMFRVMQKFKFNLALINKKSCYICKMCCSSWGDDLLEFHNHLYCHRNVMDIKCLGSKETFFVVADEKPSKSDSGPETGHTSHTNAVLADFYDSIDFGIMYEYMRLNDPSIKIICYKCYECGWSWEHYSDFKHHLNHRTHRRELKFGTEVVNRTKIRVYAFWTDLENRPLPLVQNIGRQRLMIFKCLLCKLTLDSQEQLEEHSKSLVECVCGVAGPCDDVAVHRRSCLEHLSSCYPKICICGGIYDTRDQLKAHEQTCKENTYASYQCVVCTCYSPSTKSLLEHQKKEHTVRSDEITTVTLSKCRKCKEVHAAPPIWHYCMKKQDTVKCKFCEEHFQSTYFLELHQHVFGGAKKCSVKDCFDILPSGCLQELHDIEVHDNSKMAVIECTICLSLWLNKEFGLRHVKTSHSFQKTVFPLRKLILKKATVVVKNGKIEYAQEKPAVPLRTYGNIKPKKKSTEQLNDAQSTPTDAKELPVKNETNNSVNSLQGTKVPEITAETVSMTDTEPKDKEEFTENDTKTVKEEPVDIVENDITPSDVKISYIELKEYIVTKQSDDCSDEDVGEVSANTAGDKEIKKETDEQNEELSKIFRVSKHLDRQIKLEDEIKTKIKDEPLSEDEDELFLFQEYLNESDEDEDISYVPSTSQEPISIDEFIENNKEISCLEPVVLIDEASRGKIHTCKKCNYRAPSKRYAEHVETCGMAVTPKDEKRDGMFLKSQYKPSYLEQTMTIRCSKCAFEFIDMRDYVLHLSQHGPDKVCPCCRQAFSYKQLVQHILATIKRLYVFGYTINVSADSLKISNCIQCKTVVANKDFFVHWETRHMASTNKKVDTEVEDPDDDVVKNEFTLPREVLQDTLDMLLTEDTRASRVCHVKDCKKHFARLHDYKRHLIEHLVPDVLSKKQKYKGLRCQICGDAFDRVEHYKQHMRDHAKLPLYQCQICNKCFSDSSNFAKHKKVHNLRVMICDHCGRKFQCKKMLERHLRVHINEVPHKCEQCPVAYSFRSSLKRHVNLMHSAKTARFLCQICRAQFPTVKSKWEHEWEQHKERSSDADCPICFLQFRKFSDVKTHARVEHNVKLRGRRKEVTELLKKVRKFDVPLEEVGHIFQWPPLHGGGEKAPS